MRLHCVAYRLFLQADMRRNNIAACNYLRQHRTKPVRRLRRQVFCQIVQARRRRADARQGELVQYDGKYASKMRAKREARALCGVALKSRCTRRDVSRRKRI